MPWGGTRGQKVTSYIWLSTDVRAEWPPFSALPGIWLAPFFQQKVYDWPNFSWLVYERPHFFWHPGICTYFSLSDFWGCLVSWYSLNWLHYLSWLSAINGYKKNHRAVYEWVNISDDLVYEWVRFFKGQVYEWGRVPNTGSHTRTKITPINSPPPPPTPSVETMIYHSKQMSIYSRLCKHTSKTVKDLKTGALAL